MKTLLLNLKIFLAINLLNVVIIATGCFATTEVFIDKEYKNVRQVMMHEEGKYSLVYLDENQKAHFVKIDEDYHKNCKLNIFFDVPPTEPQTARIKFVTYDGNYYGTFVRESEIHLHESSEIDGAGWNHGKFGSGRTTKVE